MIKQKSEFSLIDSIKRTFDSSKKGPIIFGIGDDCSVVDWDDQHYLITSTDMLVENIHFKKSQISAFELGWKSLAVSYSDLAAMGGGEPLFIYLSLGLPSLSEDSFSNDFLQGMKKCLLEFGGTLMGGDTVKSEQITVNILVQGKIKKDKLRMRSGAQSEDIICVTRNLGNSEIGLREILDDESLGNASSFKSAHHLPIPQIIEANWLSQFDAVHSMIDISDGLYSDLAHLCKSSNKSAKINLESIPIEMGTEKLLKKRSFCEDYSLLFTVNTNQFSLLSQNFQTKFGMPLISIGKILDTKKTDLISMEGEASYELIQGFDHFN